MPGVLAGTPFLGAFGRGRVEGSKTQRAHTRGFHSSHVEHGGSFAYTAPDASSEGA